MAKCKTALHALARSRCVHISLQILTGVIFDIFDKCYEF